MLFKVVSLIRIETRWVLIHLELLILQLSLQSLAKDHLMTYQQLIRLQQCNPDIWQYHRSIFEEQHQIHEHSCNQMSILHPI